jgi:hypothetical protein
VAAVVLFASCLVMGNFIGEKNGFMLLLCIIAVLYGLYYCGTAVEVFRRNLRHEEIRAVDKGFAPMNLLVGLCIILGAALAVYRLLPSISAELHPKDEAPIVYTGL